MQRLICFLRASRVARLLLAALIFFSFLGLAAHHHEADHDHDCSVCHALQVLVFAFAAIFFFVWTGIVPLLRVTFFEKAPLFSLFHGATIASRAPPVFA